MEFTYGAMLKLKVIILMIAKEKIVLLSKKEVVYLITFFLDNEVWLRPKIFVRFNVLSLNPMFKICSVFHLLTHLF